MSIDFQGPTTGGKPKDRYEVRYGGLQSFSPNCPLCRLLCEKVSGMRLGDATSRVLVFDFVPIYATSPQGNRTPILDGLWFRSGGKFGHLVFPTPAGRFITKNGTNDSQFNCCRQPSLLLNQEATTNSQLQLPRSV